MPGPFDASLLSQEWVHAHEEDTEGTAVYRPVDYDLPPTRGRKGFDLRPDGSLVETGIGPTDRAQQTPGTWRLSGDNRLELSKPSADQPQRVLEIESLERDKLVVRKAAPSCVPDRPVVS
jgi:hypothetical protein